MHWSRSLLAVPLALAALAAPASAATLPAGTYDAQITGGQVSIGSLPTPFVIPAVPPGVIVVPEGTPSEVTLPSEGLTIPPSMVNVSCPPSTCSVTVTVVLVGPVTAGIDPATGAAHASASAFVTMSGTFPIVGAVTCSIGTALAPVSINLTTSAPGAPWDPVSGAIKLVDNTFALPALSCSNGTVQALINLVLGSTGAGDNQGELEGTITRRPDVAPPPPPPPPAFTPPPPPPPAGPAATVPTEIRVTGSRVRLDKRGFARVRVTCVRAPVRCAGTLALTARAPRARRAGAAKTLRLARGKFSLAPGKSQLVKLKVSKKGRALLKKRSLKSTATVTAPGMTKKLTKRLTLMPPKKKR